MHKSTIKACTVSAISCSGQWCASRSLIGSVWSVHLHHKCPTEQKSMAEPSQWESDHFHIALFFDIWTCRRILPCLKVFHISVESAAVLALADKSISAGLNSWVFHSEKLVLFCSALYFLSFITWAFYIYRMLPLPQSILAHSIKQRKSVSSLSSNQIRIIPVLSSISSAIYLVLILLCL